MSKTTTELTNKAECALREYEATHKVYMETPVFSINAANVKASLVAAREKYISAMKELDPGIVVF